MKLEVEYSVETLKKVLKPLVEGGSMDDLKLDLSDELGFSLEKVIYDDKTGNLIIITPDRPEKSAVIGKGGWVVGRLREELGVKSIHVDAYSDMLVRKYRMELAEKRLGKVVTSIKSADRDPILNLQELVRFRINNLHGFNFLKDFEDELKELKIKPLNNSESDIRNDTQNHKAIIALSGGVDSSFSLVVSKLMGFNPIAVTVDPGNIILPNYFKKNVEGLSKILNVSHEYIEVDMNSVVSDALEGRIHPCGRCSKTIETALIDYAKKIGIPFLIFGDFLATGSQSIVHLEGLWRINLPAMLSATKGETKGLSSYFGIESKGGYGCPLINEVHKKHSHMRRFSIQRILRETRAGILEPGQALELIMKTL